MKACLFATFFAASFPNATSIERRAVSGVRNHIRKALVLRALAIRIVPMLVIDRQQLNDKGYTPGDNAVELAAVGERTLSSPGNAGFD